MAFRVCIFGYGVVGNAVHRLFDKSGAKVHIDDRALGYATYNEVFEALTETDIVVICINAEASEAGYDATSITGILHRLYNQNCKALVCIKTTILPEQFTTLQSTFGLNLCAWPEFLNNDTADTDIFCREQLFGGTYSQLQILQQALPHCNFHRVSPQEAFQIKMLWNLYGALKVTFWHSIQKSGFADIPSLKPKWDDWVNCHKQGDLNVIAKDGKYGFGGKCYPKDLNAFLEKFDCNLLNTVKGVNNWLRNPKKSNGN